MVDYQDDDFLRKEFAMETPKQPEAETYGPLWLAQMQSKLIELAYDAIFICDMQRRILSWNRGAESLYGYSKQQALGQVVHHLLQTRYPQPLADIHHHLQSRGWWEGELDQRSRSGKLVRVESRWVFIANEQESPAVFLEINRDITEREKFQRERIEAQAAEVAACETTQQMKTFLAIVSHELRTPLTSIKGTIQLTKRQLGHLLEKHRARPESEEQQKLTMLHSLLDRAEQQVQRQNLLINDLVTISRVNQSQLELHQQHCDLVTLAHEMVEEFRELEPARVIAWKTTVSEAAVWGDPDRISQVLTNYLTNALKYSEADKPVTVCLEVTDTMVQISVRDHGPGLSPTQQQQLWEPFSRVEGIAVKHGAGGSMGLGLFLCRALVEAQGGQVGVESQPASGSTFWFRLPLFEPENGEEGREK
jgi:PAS domain S-box-containing protein